MKTHDIIIIGARVAGASLAIRLAKEGLKVALVDQAAFPSDTLSTHFMNPRGMTYLSDLGVLADIKRVTPTSEFLEIAINGIELGGPVDSVALKKRLQNMHERKFEVVSEFACIRRTVLDQTLVQHAIRAGVQTYFEHTLIDLDQDQHHVSLSRSDGQMVHLSASIVVGADGRNSTVARTLNLGYREFREVNTFAVFTYVRNLPSLHRLAKKNRMALGVASTNDNETMVLVYGPSHFYESFKKNKGANFLKSIADIDPEFAKLFASVTSGQKLALRTAVNLPSFIRQHSTKTPLIGDAACFKDQCTASGMTHALRDSTLLADQLRGFFSGGESLETSLDHFERARYLDSFKFFDFTSQQAEMAPPTHQDIEFYRSLSKSPADRRAFVDMYTDVISPREFQSKARIERLTNKGASTKFRDDDIESSYQNPFDTTIPDLRSYTRSTANFASLTETSFGARAKHYGDFVATRLKSNTFQYERTLHQRPGTRTKLIDGSGRLTSGLNFASQDYLGLAQSPQIKEAALRALHDFGPHSSGSPMVIGNTTISRDLEDEIRKLTGKEHVLLYPTGYAAGMGAVLGLVRSHDHIVMDRLTHACLQQGAHAATSSIHRFSHLDHDAARYLMHEIRKTDKRGGILLITEGIFSMDADAPDLKRFQEIAKEYEATLLVDVAHDLGATGPSGQGQLGAQNFYGQVDIVMGSFSKTFATNGGFVASDDKNIVTYMKMYSTPFMFSNALSPISAAVALEACRMVQSPNGDLLRANLHKTVEILRSELTTQGLSVLGQNCAIVPVLIGTESQARRAHRLTSERNMAAMILEYPVVPLGATRYRLQVMATHTESDAIEAARLLSNVMSELNTTPDSLTRDQIPA